MIVGRRLALNAFAVFIALAFWTWLWGPMGAFLSSPLLIVALIVKEHLMLGSAATPKRAGPNPALESSAGIRLGIGPWNFPFDGAFVRQMNSVSGSFRCR